MSAKQKKQKLKSSQSSEPWAPQIPYIRAGFKAARQQVLDRLRSFFPDDTVADFAPEQSEAFERIGARARGGSALLRAAQGYNTSVLNGDYLGGNPYRQQAIDAASRPLIENYRHAVSGIGSSFARAGRYGSGGQALAESEAQSNLARQLSDQAAQVSFGDYNAERQRQSQAAALAPQLAEADYDDLDRLAAVGKQRQAQAQAGIDGERQRFDFNQNEALERLQIYMRLIGGNYGGTSRGSQQQPGPSNLDKFNKYASTAASLAPFLL